MRAMAFAAAMLVACTPQADAGCGFLGLFSCRHFHRHHYHAQHRTPRNIIVHKTVTINKTVVVHSHAATRMGESPIEPIPPIK